MNIRPMLLTFSAALAFAVGCDSPEPPAAHDHGHDHDHAHEHTEEFQQPVRHHHDAPRGGTLVALGDHFAHLEVLLEKDSGKLSAFVLDGHAAEPLRLAMPTISVSIEAGETSFTLALLPVASELTGEKVGDTSAYAVTDARLVKVDRFSATIPRLTIKGEQILSIPFLFPEGNETE